MGVIYQTKIWIFSYLLHIYYLPSKQNLYLRNIYLYGNKYNQLWIRSGWEMLTIPTSIQTISCHQLQYYLIFWWNKSPSSQPDWSINTVSLFDVNIRGNVTLLCSMYMGVLHGTLCIWPYIRLAAIESCRYSVIYCSIKSYALCIKEVSWHLWFTEISASSLFFGDFTGLADLSVEILTDNFVKQHIYL